nr:hypothetical protein [Nitrosomonas nitrosa]
MAPSATPVTGASYAERRLCQYGSDGCWQVPDDYAPLRHEKAQRILYLAGCRTTSRLHAHRSQ